MYFIPWFILRKIIFPSFIVNAHTFFYSSFDFSFSFYLLYFFIVYSPTSNDNFVLTFSHTFKISLSTYVLNYLIIIDMYCIQFLQYFLLVLYVLLFFMLLYIVDNSFEYSIKYDKFYIYYIDEIVSSQYIFKFTQLNFFKNYIYFIQYMILTYQQPVLIDN